MVSPPRRQAQERFPDLDLEIGAAQVDRDGRSGARRENLLHDGSGAGGRFAQAALGQACLSCFQSGGAVIFHESQEADAAPGEGQQAFAEGTGVEAIGDLHARRLWIYIHRG